MATYIVTIPDEVVVRTRPADFVEKAILEAVEPGASTHCRYVHLDPHTCDLVMMHHRLGITVRKLAP